MPVGDQSPGGGVENVDGCGKGECSLSGSFLDGGHSLHADAAAYDEPDRKAKELLLTMAWAREPGIQLTNSFGKSWIQGVGDVAAGS